MTATNHARGSVHAVPELGAQRLGAAAQVRRRRLSRGRQGHVRQRGQPLGRRQLHGRLAGAGRLWQGNATKFAPNGKPLSPITTGFTGGGMEGGTFGAAVDANDNAWFTTYGGKSIAVFDKNGKPLTPPDGITFDGKLGLMQGIIVTPSGDVWVLGHRKSQLVYFPKGDLTKGRIVCEGDSAGTMQVVPGAVPSRRSTSRTGSGWPTPLLNT